MAEVADPSRSLNLVAQKAAIVFLVFLAGSAGLGFLYLIRTILLQLVMATILALALAPLVDFLVRHRLKRSLASILALVVTLAVLVGILLPIAAPLVNEGSKLASNTSQYIESATKNPTLQKFDQKYHLVDKTKDLANSAPKFLTGAGTPVLGVVSSVFGVLTTALVVLVLTVFLLIEGPNSWRSLIGLFKPAMSKKLNRAGHRIARAIGGFVTGNLLISLIAGSVSLITLLILGVPYAFALAVLVAVFDLIPLVGASIATIVVGLVALTQGVIVGVVAVGVLLLYQAGEGQIIQPLVYGRIITLSPLLILVASLIGATLGGILGVLLAIPTASTAQIIISEIIKSNTHHAPAPSGKKS